MDPPPLFSFADLMAWMTRAKSSEAEAQEVQALLRSALIRAARIPKR